MDCDRALENKDLAELNSLLAKNIEQNLTAALIAAIFHDFEEGVVAILEAGCDPNASDEIGNFPLMKLADVGLSFEQFSDDYLPESARARYMKILIQFGADVNKRDESGRTALFYIFHRLNERDDESADEFQLANTLITLGARVDLVANDGNSLLLDMYLARPPKIVEKLIGLGVDINAKNQHGNILNHLTCRPEYWAWCGDTSNKECIEILVSAGVDMNVMDSQGQFPIDYLFRRHERSLADFMIRRGAIATNTFKEKSARHDRVMFCINKANNICNAYLKRKEVDINLATILAEEAVQICGTFDYGSYGALFNCYAINGKPNLITEIIKQFGHDELRHSYLIELVFDSAYLLASNGINESSISLFDIAMREGGKIKADEPYFYWFAFALHSLGRNDDALVVLEDSLTKFFSNRAVRLQNLYGRIKINKGDFVGAELMLLKSLETDVNGKTIARQYLAESYMRQDLLDEALKIAKQNILLNPTSVVGWGLLAKIQFAMGVYADASESADSALFLDPNYSYAKNLLSKIST